MTRRSVVGLSVYPLISNLTGQPTDQIPGLAWTRTFEDTGLEYFAGNFAVSPADQSIWVTVLVQPSAGPLNLRTEIWRLDSHGNNKIVLPLGSAEGKVIKADVARTAIAFHSNGRAYLSALIGDQPAIAVVSAQGKVEAVNKPSTLESMRVSKMIIGKKRELMVLGL